MNIREKRERPLSVLLCEAFAVFTVVYLCFQRRYDRLPLALATPILILLPEIVEKLFDCRISRPVYHFARIYALGPLLGHCYDLYYRLGWWDKLLHISGGVMFALFGLFLFRAMGGNGALCTAVFALCFSMAVSMVWEFTEFAVDQLFGSDMQNDTVITDITSYKLGDAAGEAGTLSDIQTVTVDGEPLPFAGYLDIGLHDTMWDMLLESLGALLAILPTAFDRGRHPAFIEATKRKEGISAV